MEVKIKKLKSQLSSSKLQFSKYKTYTMGKIQRLEQEKLDMIKKQIKEIKILNKRLNQTDRKMKDIKQSQVSIEKLTHENKSLKTEINTLQNEKQTLTTLVNDMLANKCGTKIITCPICRTKNRHVYIDEIYGLEQKCCVCMDKTVKLFLPSCKHACLCMSCYNHMVINIPIENEPYENSTVRVLDPIPNYMNLVSEDDLQSDYIDDNEDNYFSDF